MTPPSIRLARVIRDIPVSYIMAGNDVPNLRQLLEIEMKKRNLACKCIRCREVKNKITDNDYIINIRKYNASEGTEFFISIESPDKKIIYGFCRLRLTQNLGFIKSGGYKYSKTENDKEELINLLPFLNGAAMIRELHVYGNMTPVNKKLNNNNNHHQHRGFGKKLMETAENIAKMNGYKKIFVISGVGVRKYYEKLGYKLNNNYMVKIFNNINTLELIISIVFIIYILLNFYYIILYI
jgi:ELP3 family radical SAM enzyme/protein acetyltransferase